MHSSKLSVGLNAAAIQKLIDTLPQEAQMVLIEGALGNVARNYFNRFTADQRAVFDNLLQAQLQEAINTHLKGILSFVKDRWYDRGWSITFPKDMTQSIHDAVAKEVFNLIDKEIQVKIAEQLQTLPTRIDTQVQVAINKAVTSKVQTLVVAALSNLNNDILREIERKVK